MRFAVFAIFLIVSANSLAQCPVGEIEDCNGNCQPADWVGDGVCDDGIQFASDFMCAEYQWDLGDCDDCDFPSIEDCNGNCVSYLLIGDGLCHDDSAVNFNCEKYGYDDGDCPVPGCTDPLATNFDPLATINDGTCYYTPCPPGEFADCAGECFPLSFVDLIGDLQCHNGWFVYQFEDNTYPAPNFDCEEFDFDSGDCLIRGCTDSSALNFYSMANQDDGSCYFGDCDTLDTDCMGQCVPTNWIGTNDCTIQTMSEDLFQGVYPSEYLGSLSVEGVCRSLCVLPDGSKLFAPSSDVVTIYEVGDDPSDCSAYESHTVSLDGYFYHSSPTVDGDFVLLVNSSYGRIDVLNSWTEELTTSIPLAAGGGLDIWASHDGQHAYVSHYGADLVSKVNLTDFSLEGSISVGNGPRNLCTTPNDQLLFVSNWWGHSVSVVSTQTGEMIADVPVDYWPQAIWPDPTGEYVLVGNFGYDLSYDYISVISTESFEVVARLKAGVGIEDIITLGDSGEYIYTSNWGMACCHPQVEAPCCEGEVNKGSVSIIAMPDIEELLGGGSDDQPILIDNLLKEVPAYGEYTWGMWAHPSGEVVYAMNADSQTISIVGLIPFSDSGDSCDDAISISMAQYCIEGSTACLSDNYNEHCPFDGNGAPDIVYQYSPQVDEVVDISLCESNFDTKIYIYEGSCPTEEMGTAIYCNDDACGLNGFRSELEQVEFQAGQEYYIIVDGFNETSRGDFILCFEQECPGDLNSDGVINTIDLLTLLSGSPIQLNTTTILEFLSDFGFDCD